MKIRKVKFTRDVYDAGVRIHAAGDVKDVTPETERWRARGTAEYAEVEDEPKGNVLTEQVYDDAAKRIDSGDNTIEYTVNGIADHYKVDKATVKAELDKRIKTQPPESAEITAAKKAVVDADAELAAAFQRLEKARPAGKAAAQDKVTAAQQALETARANLAALTK